MTKHIDRTASGWIVGAIALMGCDVPQTDADGEQHVLTTLSLAASCTQESDCGGGLACVAGACQACTAHDQCRSDVCDQGAAASMGPGACVPQSAVVYVDASTRPSCETGDGSRGTPLCDIHDAIPRISGARYAIRVYSGSYLPFGLASRTVRVFGPGDDSAVVGEEDLSAAVRVTTGSHVVLDGLVFGVHVITAVICEGSDLKVLRGSAQGDANGIRATDCNLQVDRVRVGGLVRSGLTIGGTGTYRITNSYFTGGELPAVVLGGSSTGLFAFNTVTGGGELQPGGIDCGTTSRVIQDSIVIGNTPAAEGAQTVGACTHRRIVPGSGDTRPDPGLIKIDPDLDPQGRLLDTPADNACCIDKSAPLSSVPRDFFGTPRPQGLRNDIGAHELVR